MDQYVGVIEMGTDLFYLRVMINTYNQFSTLRLFIRLKCWSAVKTVSP